MGPRVVVAQTYQATIYIAGDLATARAFLRTEAYQRWLCVSLTPCEFVFTGGFEPGVAIGFANYPEEGVTPKRIWERARELAEKLLPVLNQTMVLVVATDRTEWLYLRPPGATPAGFTG